MSQEPSIGRIVHYRRKGGDSPINAAIITGVATSGGKVDLTFFPVHHKPLFAVGVMQHTGDDPLPEGRWMWPPRVE